MDSDCEGRFIFSDELLRKTFNSLSAHIAIIDQDGFILETNAAWKNFSVSNGLPENIDFRQMNYLNICEAAVGDHVKDAKAVASGIRKVIDRRIYLPYIQKLKQGQLSEKDKTLVGIVDDHLNDIISPLMQSLSNAGVMLTPQEMQVLFLVKDGKTTSEIADILFVSEATISFHRKNLRDKPGLKNRQTNIRSFLLSMS